MITVTGGLEGGGGGVLVKGVVKRREILVLKCVWRVKVYLAGGFREEWSTWCEGCVERSGVPGVKGVWRGVEYLV